MRIQENIGLFRQDVDGSPKSLTPLHVIITNSFSNRRHPRNAAAEPLQTTNHVRYLSQAEEVRIYSGKYVHVRLYYLGRRLDLKVSNA